MQRIIGESSATDRPALRRRLVGKAVTAAQGKNGPYVKWSDKYFRVSEGSAAALTLGQAVGLITQVQDERDPDASEGEARALPPSEKAGQ